MVRLLPRKIVFKVRKKGVLLFQLNVKQIGITQHESKQAKLALPSNYWNATSSGSYGSLFIMAGLIFNTRWHILSKEL